MAANLRSMTEEKYSKANFTGIERQEDAPVGEAVAMMVREKLTGERPPASAGKVLDLWRSFIEDKAGSEFDNLSEAINDQQAFAKVIRNMLSAMEMAEEYGDDDSEADNDDQSEQEDQPSGDEQDQDEVDEDAGTDAAPVEDSEVSDEQMEDGETEGAEISDDDMMEEGEDDSERRARPAVRTHLLPTSTKRSIITSIPKSSTRSSPPRSCAMPPSWSACAPSSTSSWRICRARSGGSPIGCNAA